jgi:hypothetical protein
MSTSILRKASLLALAGAAACSANVDPKQGELVGASQAPIVNGYIEPNPEWTGVVALQTSVGNCSGVLLTNQFLASAAHCFQAPDMTNPPANVMLTMGSQQRVAGAVWVDYATDIAIIATVFPFSMNGQLVSYFLAPDPRPPSSLTLPPTLAT